MEHLCKVRTAWTNTLDRETYFPYHFNSKERIVRYVLWLLIVLALNAFAVWQAIDFAKYWQYYSPGQRIFFLFLVVYYLYLDYRIIFITHIYARKEAKRRRKLVGDKVPYSEFLFYDEHIFLRSGVSSVTQTIRYADMIELIETKHYCVVRITTGAFAFDKSGFVDGTYAQALQLLREKGNIKK